MTAVFTSNGLGLFGSSADLLGQAGLLGGATPGQSGEQVYVNAVNGNLVVQRLDEILVGQGVDASLTRAYNSQGGMTDSNGDDWVLSISRFLTFSGQINTVGSTVTRHGPDGSLTVFAYDSASGEYVSTDGAGAHNAIRYDAANSAWIWEADGGAYSDVYDANGVLQGMVDRDGNQTVYSYDGSDRLTTITLLDPSGSQDQVITFGYGSGVEAGLIKTVTVVSDGVTTNLVSYDYDASQRLSVVTVDLTPDDAADSNIYTTTYTYEGASTRISTLTQSDGTSLTFDYIFQDGVYRVEWIENAANERTSFFYNRSDANGTYTEIQGPTGATSKVYTDSDGQLRRLEGPADNGQRTVLVYGYDADGNLTTITDGAANQTTFTYDARGNRLSSQDSLGNRTEWTYTSDDLVATETAFTVPDPDGNGPAAAQGELTTRWTYDAEGHVTHIIDASGGVTRFTYDAVGNQTSRQVFADAAYDTSGLARDAVPAASTIDNWILTIDRSHSELTEYGYDFRGQLETVTRWEQLDSSGAGVLGTESIARYVYDHTGKLVKQITARGELTAEEDFVTVFGYDGLNRITSRTAAEGQSVTTTYADSVSGTTVSATTSAGLLTVSSYDVSGRLVSVAQSGASGDYGTTEFSYTDGLLRATLSTAGARSYSFYDDANRLQYSVDETGAVTETIYDALGRVDQRISYANSADTTTWWDGVNGEVGITTTQFEATYKPGPDALDRSINYSYDDSGRLTAETDGVLETRYTYDGLSRLTLQSSQALDGTGATRESRIFYDEVGRQVATLDAEGALVESRYDAAGRLVQQLAYANEVAAGNRTSPLDTILAGLAPHADDQSVHYYYDDRGQLIGMVDGERYLTSYEYDEDGNRISATRYANDLGPVSLATDVRPSATLSPDDQTSTFEYDQSGRLLQTTNHRGDIQAYAYDDNDNVVRIDRFSTAPNGEVRRQFMRYDEAGRLTGELSPEQAKALDELSTQAAIDAAIAADGIERIYDIAGRLIRVTDQVGNDVWFYYDDRGQLRYSINALGEVQESEYNSFGEVSRQTSYANRVNVMGLTGGSASAVESLVTAAADPSADRITRFEFDARGLLARQISRALDAQSTIHELETDFDYTVWGQLDTVTTDTTFNGAQRTQNSFTYDLMGRELTSTFAVGPDSRTQTVDYDAFGRVVSQFDELNRETRLEYDRNGRLIDVFDPLNRNRHTTYDAFGRTISVLDELQRETTFDFDDATRTVTMTMPGNIVTVSRQNEFGETVEVIDAEQVSTVFDYDQNGNLLTTTVNVDGQDQTVVNDYDTANRLTRVTDAAGRVIEYRYDAVNRLFQQITDPDGIALTTEFEYNSFGQQVLITDAGNRVTEIRHDLQGRVIEQIVDPGVGGANLVTRFEHDARGRQVAVVTAAGTGVSVRTEYVYNDFGQLETKTVDPGTGGLGLTTSYEYDDAGNMIKRTDAAGAVTHYVYDGVDRLQYTLEEVGNGKGYVTETVYDDLDRVVVTHRYADEFDMPAAGAAPVINVAGVDRESLWNVYDDAGRIAFNINEEDYVTGYVYDDNGRLITNNRYDHKASSPETATASTLQSEINVAAPDVAQTTIQYDELGRERFLTEADQSVKEFRYDASGNLVESVLPGGVASTRYFYDAAGRKRYELDAAGNLVRLTQDGSGNLVLRQVFDAAAVGNLAAATTAESVDSAIASLLANQNGQVAALRNEFLVYDTANRLRYSVDGLGQVTWQDYDEAGRVIETRRYAGSLSTVTVTTDVADLDLLLASEDYRSTKFAYDEDNRLRFTVDSLNRVTEQVFDDAGNMVEQIRYRDDYQLSDFSESGLDSHYAAATAKRVTGFEYDALGRSTSMTNALLQTERYEYDAYGNRTAFINKADNRWEYKYDGVGNLVEEMTPQETFYRTDISDPDNPTVTPILGYQVTSMEYDYRGNVKKLIEGVIRRDSLPDDVTQRYETTFGYDALGRQTSISYIVGEGAGTTVSVTTRYDALGNAVANEDVRGNVSYKIYDSLGRQRFDIDAEGYVTENRYDAFGNLIELVRYANRQAGLLGTVNTVHTLADMEALVASAAVASGANRTLTHEYDAGGQRTRTVAGAVNAYDGATDTAYTSSPETLYAYNAFGELSQERRLVSDADSTPVWADTYRFYNAAGQLTAEVNAGGYLTTTEHNGYGETSRVTEHARALADISGIAAADKDADFSPALAPLPSAGTGVDAPIGADRVREYEYDALGRVTGEFMLDVAYSTYANGIFTTGLNAARLLLQGTEYDAVGNVSRVTDSASNSLQTGFNTLGHAIWTKEVARDVMLSTQAGANGLAYNSALDTVANQTRSPLTTYQYDVFGNVLVEHDWANGAIGSATSSTGSSNDRVTYYRYDNARRKVEELDAEGNSTLYAYDAAGNITSESRDYYGARGVVDTRYTAETRYVYDALGQQITTMVLLGTANQIAHAAVGNQLIEVAYNAFGEVVNRGTNRSSYEETFVYDDAGRLIQAPNEYGKATTYSYDLLGNLTRETSDTTGESVYHYDTLGRGTRVDRPIVFQNYDDTAGVYTGGTTILEYDRWDNVVSQTERSVRWTDLALAPTAAYQNRWDFNYNKFDQVTKEVQPETNIVGEDGQEAEGIPEVLRYYDALGRQVAETDTRSNSRYRVYNNANQVVEEIDALGNATKYAYDVFGRQVAKQNALGYITTTDYDRLDQAVLIGDLRYDSANTQSYNQQLIAHTYNALGHQVSTTYSQSIDVNGLQTATSYSDYDVRGNLVRSESATGMVVLYSYDSQGRRTLQRNGLWSSGNVDQLSWAYDYFGRVQSYNNLGGVEYGFAYDATTGLLAFKGTTAQLAQYQADPNNLSGGITYEYYDNGALKRFQDWNDGITAEYEYDHAGRRTYEFVDGIDSRNDLYSQVTRTEYDEHGRVYRVVTTDLLQAGGLDTMDAIYGYDEAGNRRYVKVSSRYSASYTPPTNAAPTVTAASITPPTVMELDTVRHTLGSNLFTDSDGDTLSYFAEIVPYDYVSAGWGVIRIPVGQPQPLPSWVTLDVVRGGTDAFYLDITAPPLTASEETDYSASGQAGEYVVRLHARDQYGAEAIRTFNINILDWVQPNDPPTVGTPIGTVTRSEGQPINFTIPASAFNDPDGHTLRYTANYVWGRVEQTGIDGEGFPILEWVEYVDPLPSWLTFNETTGTFGGSHSGFSVDQSFTIRVQAHETDTQQMYSSGTQDFTLTIEADNEAPVVNNAPPSSYVAVPGQLFTRVMSASTFTDPNGDLITYSASGMPGWLSFNQTSRTFSGTPSTADVGSTTITLTGTDPEGLSVSTTFAVVVNSPPQLDSAIGNRSPQATRTFNYNLASNFSDADGDTLTFAASQQVVEYDHETGQTFTYYVPLPSWMSLSSAGVLTGTPPTAEVGSSYTIRVIASDGIATRTTYFDLTVTAFANLPPTAGSGSFTNQSVAEGGSRSYTFPSNVFSDPDGQALTYTATVGGVSTTSLSWASINSSTRTLTFNPGYSQAGTYTVAVTARDTYGATYTRSFTLTVNNTNRAPTVANPIPNRSGVAGAAWSYVIPSNTFSDPDGTSLTLSITSKPSWMSWNAGTRTLSGTPPTAGSYNVTVRASDGSLTVSDTFTLTVTANDAPVLNNPPASSYSANVGYYFNLDLPSNVFTDPNGDAITYSASGMPSWMSFTPSTVRFTGTPNVGGVYTITLRATDPYGAQSSTTFTLDVNTPPQLSSSIGNRSPQASRAFSYNIGSHFTDADGDTLTFTADQRIQFYEPELNEWITFYSSIPSWMSFSSTGVLTGTPPTSAVGDTFTIRVTASDGQRTVTSMFNVNVVAYVNTPPTAGPGSLTNQSVAEGGSRTYTFPSNAFTDPDGHALTYTARVGGVATTSLSWANLSGRTLTFNPGYSQAGTYTVAITARDTYGATYTRSFTLTVTNTNRAPTVANAIPNQSASVGVAWGYTIPSNTFTDPDGNSLSYSITSKPSWMSWNASTRRLSGTPPSAGTWNVTVRASDGSLTVTDTFSVTATVVPVNQAPEFSQSSYFRTFSRGDYIYINFSLLASDPDGDTLTYSGSGVPSGLSLNSSTGVLNGNLYSSMDRSFTVTVSDGSLSDTIFVELIYMGGGGLPLFSVDDPVGETTDSKTLTESGMTALNGTAAGTNGSAIIVPTEESTIPAIQVGAPKAGSPGGEEPAAGTQNMGQGPFYGPYDWAWDIDYIDEWYTINATPYVTVNQKEYWYTYDAENRIKIAEGVLDVGTGTIGIDNTQGHILDYDAAGNQIMRTTSLGSVMRAEAFRYNALGQLVTSQKSDGTFSIATGLDEAARLALYNNSSQWQDVSKYEYDLAGRIKKQVDYFIQGDYREVRVEVDDNFDLQTVSVAGNVKSATYTYYDDDGRVTKVENMGLRDGHFRSLLVWMAGSNQPLSRESDLEVVSQVIYDAGDYDAAGNVQGYRYQKILNVDEGSDPVREAYTIHYNYTYEKRDSYQINIISGSGTGTHQKDSTSDSNYDSAGRLISVFESYDIADYTEEEHRYFRYNGDSQIIYKVGGTYDSGTFTPESDGSSTRHFYFTGGNQIGSVDGSGRIFFEDQAAYQIAKTGSASNAQTYTARDGDTLRSVARVVYGSETLWYVIADANGMSDDTERLRDGQSLRIPAFNSAVNDADSFKAFNAEEVIGDRTPAVPYVPPPPSADKGCGIIGQIIMIVVAIVVTVYTAGLAAGGAGVGITGAAGATTASTSVWATGTAALSGGIAGAGGLAVGAGAAFVGGFAGSVASQLVGKALGVVDSFSLKSAFASGLTSAASSALSGMDFFKKANDLKNTTAIERFGIRAARGAATYLSAQAAQIIVGGERSSFSWASVAAAGLGSAAGGLLSDNLSEDLFEAFGKKGGDFALGLTTGVASAAVSKALGVGGKVELQAIAVDAFANTVGNSIVEHYEGKAQEEFDNKRREQAEEDAKKVAEAAAGQAATISDDVQDVMAKETLETTVVVDEELADRVTQQADGVQELSSGIGNDTDESRLMAEESASQIESANAPTDERLEEYGPFADPQSNDDEPPGNGLDGTFVSPGVLKQMEDAFDRMFFEHMLNAAYEAELSQRGDDAELNALDRLALALRENQSSFNAALDENAHRMLMQSIENPGMYSYSGMGYVDPVGSAIMGAWLFGGAYEFTTDTIEFAAHPINNTVDGLTAIGSFMGDSYLANPYGFGMYGVPVYMPELYDDPLMQEMSLAAQQRLNARFDAGLLAFDEWLENVNYAFENGNFAELGALTFEPTVGVATLSVGAIKGTGSLLTRSGRSTDPLDIGDLRLIPGTPGVVTGGSSQALGRNMLESLGMPRSMRWTGYQAQHIIPSEFMNHPVIQRIGMDFDNASNGLFLRIPDDGVSAMSRHRGYHSVYNEVVDRALSNIDVTQNVSVIQQQVYDLQQNLRTLQLKGTPLYPSQGATVELWERLLGQ